MCTQALRFYGSFNPTVTGITIQNSPQCHLKFDSCNGVMVHDVSISSPGDSPNTDGIHLQNSKDVLIYGSNLACGNVSIPDELLHIFHFIRTTNAISLRTEYWKMTSVSVNNNNFLEGSVVDRTTTKMKMKVQNKKKIGKTRLRYACYIIHKEHDITLLLSYPQPSWTHSNKQSPNALKIRHKSHTLHHPSNCILYYSFNISLLLSLLKNRTSASLISPYVG